MDLHEFQSKRLLQSYGIVIPDSFLLESSQTIDQEFEGKDIQGIVIKAQVHAGGRGKAGGIKTAHSKKEAMELARTICGMKITNRQTGPEGITVKKVLVEKLIPYEKQFYIGLIIDRKISSAALIVSSSGGMEIEEIAKTFPEKIFIEPILQRKKLWGFQKNRIASFLGWEGAMQTRGIDVIDRLITCFFESDGLVLEINPLVESSDGIFVALDAKMSIDDNALFRQEKLRSLYDASQLSEKERKAKEQDLAFVTLDGTIGCIVNGAGLAMATMDLIYSYGGRAANFLDVGGSASEEKILEGFSLLLTDRHLKAILVNIFGGIMDCRKIASGLIQAVEKDGLHIPLVIRLEGTNVDEAKKLIHQANLNVIFSDTLDSAAKTVVQESGGY